MAAPPLAADLPSQPPPELPTQEAASADAPVASGSGGRPPRSLLAASIAFSLALHAAAAAAMLAAKAAPDFGAIDQPSDTFSLSTSQTLVLESINSEPVTAASAASAAMPQGTVQSVDAEPQPLTKVEEVAEEAVAPPQPVKATEVAEEVPATEDPLEVIRGAGEPVETTPAKAQEAEEKQEETEQQQREERSKTRRQVAQRLRSRSAAAGGPSSRSSTATAAVSGQVTASRGSLLSYGALVRAKVAHNKPPGSGRHGVAKVSFAITPAGELSFAQLSDSSGDAALDAAAIAAVRQSAPFGPPPAGTAPEGLRFAIRFTFR